MTTHEWMERDPVFRPNLWLGRLAVWFFDDRWRLPYRLTEWKWYRGEGFALMLFGAALMVMWLKRPAR